MKSTHRFQVKAPIKFIYYKVLSAEGWLSFVPGYRGVEIADSNWPDEGSSITSLYRLLKRIKVTVVEHAYGHRFLTHEEAFSGLYIDNVEVTFQEEDEMTEITLIRDVTSRSILVRNLLLLLYPLRWVTAHYVKRKIKAMVET